MERIEQARQALTEAREALRADNMFTLSVKIDGALSALEAEGGTATHRHKKRGSEYTLIGIGKMQAEGWLVSSSGHPDEWPSVDMCEVAVYRGTDGQLWVRPREEFEDGRFEALEPRHD